MRNRAFEIRSNYRVHGALFTLQWAKKQGINMDTVHFVLTGKYRKGAKHGMQTRQH